MLDLSSLRTTPYYLSLLSTFNLFLPLALTLLLQLSIPLSALTIIALANKQNEEIVAAATLGLTFFNCFGVSMVLGFSTAMDTLISQKKGAGGKGLNQVAQTFLLVCLLVLLPILVLIAGFSQPILTLLAQPNPAIAAKYIYAAMASMPFYMIFEILKKYAQAGGRARPILYIMIVVAGLHGCICYALVVHTRLNLLGAPVAQAIVYIVGICLSIFTFEKLDIGEPWRHWTRSVWDLKEWKQIIILGTAGMVQTCAEWWAFEIVVFVAGRLGIAEQAAQGLTLQTSGFFYMIPLSVSIASSIRIGTLVGAGDSQGARVASRVGLGLGLAVSAVNAVIFASARFSIANRVSDKPEVTILLAKIMGICAIYQIPDGICTVCSGILRGCGKQRIGAASALIAYYVIGLPVGLSLAFHTSLGLAGAWYGIVLGLGLSMSFLLYFVMRHLNWENEVTLAAIRTQSTSEDAFLNSKSTLDSALSMPMTPTSYSDEDKVNSV